MPKRLEALRQNEADTPPASWKLSPRSVLAYIIGGKTLDATIDGKKKKVEITRKFFGDTAIVERAIVTLASDRALLLVGDPGTGKELAQRASGCRDLREFHAGHPGHRRHNRRAHQVFVEHRPRDCRGAQRQRT